MLSTHVENIGDMAIIECQGRIVQSDAAFKLRKAILSQVNSRVIVIDLTDVHAIEGGGLGMLSALQKWAENQHIQLKLFNPTSSVKNRLEHHDPVKFQIAAFGEMMTLLASAEMPEARAA